MPLCCKFIVPPVDDNVRLTVAQYRKLIYQDIERMHPEENCVVHHYKESRSTHSFTKYKQEETKCIRRQRSLIQTQTHSKPVKYGTCPLKQGNSPLKLKENNATSKVFVEAAKADMF